MHLFIFFCSGLRDVVAILLNGLKRLEYRGYDSAGIGVITQEEGKAANIRVIKKQVSNV